ncbi:hypothetical protein Bca52824_080275 [Brassica carinata]|uniref:Senescence-associated protein n=1 Tax=Brassica carinata TaxID=52824 RepID=A0A8X7TQH7_BRACI|nr:hypothetical protein Bca52824_080275 [Brassica carinata]
MIGRADIEGSKSNVAMNAWLPQASYPCGTENQNQASFYPFVPHEISVLVELILGHLRYLLTDVPPQPNSPPDNVLRPDRPRRVLGLKKGCYPPPIPRIGLESSSTGSSFPADSAKHVPLAVVSLDSRRGHRISLVRTSSELAVRRPGKSHCVSIRKDHPPADTRRSARHVSGSSSRQQGCSPWRPDAVMMRPGVAALSVLTVFKGAGMHGHPRRRGALPAARTLPRLSVSRICTDAAIRARPLGFAATPAPSYSSRPGSCPAAGIGAVGHRNPASVHPASPVRLPKWPTWSSRFRGMAQQSSHPSYLFKANDLPRQYRCGPPPEFPLAARSGIVHHLSVPTGMLTLEPFSEDPGRSAVHHSLSVFQGGSNGSPQADAPSTQMPRHAVRRCCRPRLRQRRLGGNENRA